MFVFIRLAALVAVGALATAAVQVGQSAAAADRALVLNAAQTDRALLVADDLPAGWKPLKPEAPSGNGFCSSRSARGRASAAGPSIDASAAFGADVLHGPFVSDDVYAFRSPEDARRFVSSTKRAVSTCPGMIETYQESGVEVVSTYVVGPSSPVDGVELTYTVALETTRRLHVAQTVREVAYLRRGAVVSVVGRSADHHDHAAFRQLERAALRRMAMATRPGPPATSGSRTSASTACTRILDPPGSHPLDAGQDGVLVIRAQSLAPLPTPPDAALQVDGIGRIESVDVYLRETGVGDEIVWRDRLRADGFAIAESIGYSGAVGDYGAQALRFTSTARALDFQRSTLGADCRRGVATDVAALDGVPSAFTYGMDQQGLTSRRSSTVIGPFVVLLDLYPCPCTSEDAKALVANWTRAVAAQLGVPHVR